MFALIHYTAHNPYLKDEFTITRIVFYLCEFVFGKIDFRANSVGNRDTIKSTVEATVVICLYDKGLQYSAVKTCGVLE